ncbi:UDP-N-acetylmuramoyl-L-alanyl-D-glutamate--2,6-diaminopimelate ligase [Paenibacillus sp. GCM10027626]|uniref:UDP-N-acetylmuramoyl-L-alanyl-D-glutamate--2, 6-diaminopimelate ligase n=1 Tax=Paenibacillus sp. GCM10027626 TaxID=3273411 RepID=UPI00363EBB44
MQLKELTNLLKTAVLHGDGDLAFAGIQTDSRKVQPGDLFICLPGHTVDGHDYAQSAIEHGAAALVVERLLTGIAEPQLVVKNARFAMAVIADWYYGHPSHAMKLIGITGTNGKTTTTYLVERIFADNGYRPGVIGTVEMRYNGQVLPMSGTTPDALELQRHLAEMVKAGTDCCAMEVSSHALEQGRVKGCRYRTAIFTNLTQDHLDYHGTMERYAAAKGLFFSRLGNAFGDESERSYAVLNADDAASGEFAALTAAEVLTYGVEQAADVRASNIQITSRGTAFQVDTYKGSTMITLKMAGKFNVYNALAAITAALIENIPLEQIKASLEAIAGVPGRVEAVDAGQPFAVIVDYAHTPDGLENVLKAVQQFAAKRMICVFGCGGDRDRAKRPIMGAIAAAYADHVIITSDNPRTEEPQQILRDIESGLKSRAEQEISYELVADRREAIQKAVEMASPDDVVLIAGKGHETYQIIGMEKLPFDDREVAKEAIRSLVQ